MNTKHRLVSLFRGGLVASLSLGALLVTQPANAVPSFARQTGMACSACHTVFPKLTLFGRLFKLNGYTMTGLKQIQAKQSASAPGLQVNAIAPMSAMVQIAMTHVNNPGPTSQNNYLTFPTGLSLYYAGEISAHTGAFIQVTMDNAMSNFAFDMADLRWAKTTSTAGGTPITYGIALDNMPGMDDLWNTTPAWTYPYLAASPDHGTSSPAVNGMMGTGLGAYAMFDNHWYGYLSVYDPMAPNIMAGKAEDDTPYWRLAWQGNLGENNYLEAGTYGVIAKVYGTPTTSTDTFTDTALDAQFEHQLNHGQINAHVVYIHESQSLDASNPTAASQHMDQYRADVAYNVGDHYQYQLGYFSTTASSGAYAWDGMMTTSAYAGNDSGLVAEVDVLPWENTKYSIQYTSYDKYDGASGSNGNTLLLNAWYMW